MLRTKLENISIHFLLIALIALFSVNRSYCDQANVKNKVLFEYDKRSCEQKYYYYQNHKHLLRIHRTTEAKDNCREMLDKDFDDIAKATLYYDLGSLYNYLGEFDSSQYFYYKALKIDVQNKYSNTIYPSLAVTYSKQGKYKKAFELYQKGIEHAKKAGDIKNLHTIYQNIGVTYTMIGDYDKALENYIKSAKIAYLDGDMRAIGSLAVNTGNLYQELEDEQNSIFFYQTAANIYTNDEESTARLSRVYNNIASMYINIGKYELAKKYLKLAKTEATKVKNHSILALVYVNLAIINRKEKQYLEAKKYILLARSLVETTSLVWHVAHIYIEEARIAKDMNDWENAEKYAKKALQTDTESTFIEIQKDAAQILSEYFERKNNLEKAFYYLKEYQVFSDSIKSSKIMNASLKFRVHLLEKNYLKKLNFASKKNMELRKENQNQFYFNLLLILSGFIGLTILVVLRKNYNLKQRALRALEKKQQELTESHLELEKLHLKLKIVNENLDIQVVERTKSLLKTTEELQKSKKQLATKNEELIEKTVTLAVRNKIMKQLALSNTHDIRKPIANIEGLLTILSSYFIADDKEIEILDKLKTSVEELNERIILNIRTYESLLENIKRSDSKA